MEYQYKGYTGKNGGALKSLSRASSTYAKYKSENSVSAEEKAAEDRAKAEAERRKADSGKSLLQKAGDKAVEIGKGIAGNAQRVAGTAAQGAISLAEIPLLIGAANGDKRAERALLRADKTVRAIGDSKAIDGGSNSFISKRTLDDKSSTGQFAAELTKAGADTAAFVQPGLKTANLLKGLGLEVGINAGTTGIASAADQYATDGKVDLGKTAKDAIVGGATAGIVRGAGGIIGKARGSKTAEPAAVVPTEKQLAAQASLDAQAKLDAERPFNAMTDDELVSNIEAFNSGEGRTGDVKFDYQRAQQLHDEQLARVNEQDRQAFVSNGLPNDVPGAQKALDDLNDGTNIPETAYKPSDPVESAVEVAYDKNMPVEIRNAANEVVSDRKMIEDQMFGLMSKEAKDAEITRLDDDYNARMAELTKRYSSLEKPAKRDSSNVSEPQKLSPDYKTDVRFTVAKDKLDEQYRNDVAELDMLEAADSAEVAQYEDMLSKLDVRDAQIVRDANMLMDQSPNEFKQIDANEFNAHKELLTQNLEQAKRFNEPARIVEEVSEASDPVKAFDRNPDAPEAFKKEVSSEIDKMPNTDAVKKNFTNITGTKLATLRLMSPSQVLQAMGLRNKDVNLFQDVLRAETALNKANQADSKVLESIAKVVPNDKNAQAQIIDYLEGKRQTITLDDMKAADQIKGWLDEKRAGLKDLGFGTIDDYFPHIFDKKDPDVIRLFQAKASGEINFSNLKSRLSDSEDYSKDIMNVLATYASGYNRKVHLEPAIKPLADLRKQVELQEKEAEWVDGYVKQLMGFDKSALADGYNGVMDSVLKKIGLENSTGKNHFSQHLGTQRMISAVATMGLNPGTAIRNLTQMVNTVADIGPRYSLIGAMDGTRALRAGPKSAEWAELERVGVMGGGVSQNFFDAIQSTGVRGRITKGRDAATKGMMSLIRVTDISLRAQAYYGAKAMGAKKGLTGDALEKFAADKVVDTQFITSRVDMPTAFNGQAVRSMTQLATFSGKQLGFLKRTVGGITPTKNKDGTYSIPAKQMGSVLAAIATATVATETLKPLLGFRDTEWIPFYDQVAPFASAITGQEVGGGDSLYRSPLVQLLAGDGKSKIGLIQALQGQDTDSDGTKSLPEGFEKFFADNWSGIVPAGTQIKKTTEGINTTQSGESTNKSGNIRYLQDMDIDSKTKAAVFGQYSTEAGQSWIKDGFPTLSDSQTQKVDEQTTRQAKEQYVDFYQAAKKAKGRQDAYDEAKAAAEDGNINRAATIADEYNTKVEEAMSSYWGKHEDMPDELRQYLNGKLRININKIEEAATK